MKRNSAAVVCQLELVTYLDWLERNWHYKDVGIVSFQCQLTAKFYLIQALCYRKFKVRYLVYDISMKYMHRLSQTIQYILPEADSNLSVSSNPLLASPRSRCQQGSQVNRHISNNRLLQEKSTFHTKTKSKKSQLPACSIKKAQMFVI